MRKLKILCILIALYPVISFGQQVYSLNDIQIDSKSGFVYDKNHNPLTGNIVYVLDKTQKWQDTAVFALPGARSWSNYPKMELSVQNGKKDGKMKFYDENGALIEEYNYKDGYLDGTQIEYDRYHSGEISRKTEYKMNRCIKRIHYRKGKPFLGYRAKNNPSEPRVSKVTGLPVTELPAKTAEHCHEQNSLQEYYDEKGNVLYSVDASKHTRTYYYSNNKVYVDISPVPQNYKDKADFVYTAYYENGKPMLKLTVKGDQAIAGEFYSEKNEKTVLDSKKATDYLMDIALSINLGAR